MTSEGCPYVFRKFVIRFSELSTIPNNATITSAQLKLHTPNTNETNGWGNSVYPNTPFSTDNSCILKRILPGASNAWQEMQITWNNSLNLTFAPPSEWIPIPTTTSRYNVTTTIDVTNLVATIIQDKNNRVTNYNNGFLIELNDYETIYKSQYFGSSDNTNSLIHPELIVTYNTENSEPCDANFTSSYPTNNPLAYIFTAIEPNAYAYEWTINGIIAGINNTLSHTFAKTDKESEVCLKVYMSESVDCTVCTKISDATSIDELNAKIKLQVFPNPTLNNWNIIAQDLKEHYHQYLIRDINGRILEKNTITKNNFEIGSQLKTGFYILELTGNQYHYQTKIIKQ